MPEPRLKHVPSFRNVVVISVLLRAALIVYSEWHDAHSVVKYTDVDYRVFSDATTFILRPDGLNFAQGWLGQYLHAGDPYTRATYRYTPLLAALLAPNEWIHPSFGKYLFAGCDILNGVLIYNLLVSVILPRVYGNPPHPSQAGAGVSLETRATLLTATHLLNPLIFTISTRGSSESVLASLVLATLYATLKRHWDIAAIGLGLATHWKIYPVVYGLSCLGCLREGRAWVNYRSVRFTIISGGTFFALGLLCYLVWGQPFLDEAFLYHLHRLDHRHNFSPYFYLTYLAYSSLETSNLANLPLWQTVLRSPLVSFAPQMLLSLGSGLLLGNSNDLPFAWFVQTSLFVLFNKVCTSQYFLWYLIFLPLIIPRLSLSRRQSIACGVLWIGSQAMWLSEAYRLEFLGDNVFFGLWLRSLAYVVTNAWVLSCIIQAYCAQPEANSDKETSQTEK